MYLDDVLESICNRAGITSTRIDVTDLSTIDVVGFTIPRQMPARTAIETLMAAYNFDAVETDWKLIFKKRGSTSVATIPAKQMRAYSAGESVPDRAVETRTQDLELPTHFTLSYESKVRDYEIASQHAIRVDKENYLPRESALGIVLTDSHAKQQAEILLMQMWTNRHRYAFSTTYKYLYLAPGDVITVNGKLMRVIEMADRNGIVDFVCESEQGGNYKSDAEADDLTINPIDLTDAAYIPVFISMNIPAINEDFGNAGLTFAMYGSTQYSGGAIQRSIDGGVTFADAWYFGTVGAVVGNVSNALSSGVSGIIDKSTTLTVDLTTSAGAVATVNTSQLWNNANLAAIGSQANGWEIVQFLTATSSTGYTYNITGFLRGLYGTEELRGTHTTSDKFVLLTNTSGTMHSGVDFISSDLSNAAVSFPFRARNPSGAVGESTALTIRKKTLVPYAPQIGYGSRNSSNDVEIGWYRGDRYEFTQADFPDGGDIEQNEVSLSYKVNVIHPVSSAVVRTIDTTESTWTYTAAMQSSDSYPNVHPIIFDIYQWSTVVSTSGPALRVLI